MKIGYARVSTSDQNLDMQINALKEVGCSRIFTDISSGKNDKRVGLIELIEFARPQDTVYTYRLDRISRSLQSLIRIINKFKENKVEFVSLREKIDTDSPGGNLIFHIFAALSEFERDIIRERTIAGLKAAKARGKVGGRPKVIDKEILDQIQRMYNAGISVRTISKQIQVSIPTIYRYLSNNN